MNTRGARFQRAGEHEHVGNELHCRRPGFTLLEVLLASTIAIMLLAALYASFDIVIKQSDAGRSETDRNDLSRAVVNRITIDLSGTVGPLPPKSGGTAQAEAANAATMGETTEEPTTDPATETTEEPATTSTAVTVASIGGDIPFSAGCIGTSTTMSLFVSRVPASIVNKELQSNGSLQTPDLRRVTYYLGAAGLCRQERQFVTQDGVWNNADADRTDEFGDLLAEEITNAQFQYFDGSTWVDSWDGSQLATDGKSLLGPPRAVKITFTVERANAEPRRFAHVFALRAASGLIVVEAPATEETTETMP
jgi:type II secretory pathway pseudopilin PulG